MSIVNFIGFIISDKGVQVHQEMIKVKRLTYPYKQ